MVSKGPAKKQIVSIDEADKFHGKPVYDVNVIRYTHRDVNPELG